MVVNQLAHMLLKQRNEMWGRGVPGENRDSAPASLTARLDRDLLRIAVQNRSQIGNKRGGTQSGGKRFTMLPRELDDVVCRLRREWDTSSAEDVAPKKKKKKNGFQKRAQHAPTAAWVYHKRYIQDALLLVLQEWGLGDTRRVRIRELWEDMSSLKALWEALWRATFSDLPDHARDMRVDDACRCILRAQDEVEKEAAADEKRKRRLVGK